jgi:hypothetical protein
MRVTQVVKRESEPRLTFISELVQLELGAHYNARLEMLSNFMVGEFHLS